MRNDEEIIESVAQSIVATERASAEILKLLSAHPQARMFYEEKCLPLQRGLYFSGDQDFDARVGERISQLQRRRDR